MKLNPRFSFLAIPLALTAVACSEVAPETPAPVEDAVFLEIEAELPVLGDDGVYEGWVVSDGQPFSTGRFSVDETGFPHQAIFEIDEELAVAGNLFVLTIEPAVEE